MVTFILGQDEDEDVLKYQYVKNFEQNGQSGKNQPMPNLTFELWRDDVFIISQNLTSTGIITKNIDQPLLQGQCKVVVRTDKPIAKNFQMGVASYSKNNYYTDINRVVYVEDNSF